MFGNLGPNTRNKAIQEIVDAEINKSQELRKKRGLKTYNSSVLGSPISGISVRSNDQVSELDERRVSKILFK